MRFCVRFRNNKCRNNTKDPVELRKLRTLNRMRRWRKKRSYNRAYNPRYYTEKREQILAKLRERYRENRERELLRSKENYYIKKAVLASLEEIKKLPVELIPGALKMLLRLVKEEGGSKCRS